MAVGLWDPFLSNSYVKTLGEVIRTFGLKYHQYAVDTQFSFYIPSDLKEVVHTLNRRLEGVMG